MVDTRNHLPIAPADEPLTAVAEEGVVLVDGPTGIAITLTSQAATASARAIATAASAADGQGKPAEPFPPD